MPLGTNRAILKFVYLRLSAGFELGRLSVARAWLARSWLAKTGLAGLWLGSLCLIPATHASELKNFVRCYKKITGSVPAVDSARYQQVRAGGATGAEACLQVLAQAKLTEASETMPRAPSDPEVKQVLRNFHQLHRAGFRFRLIR